MSDQINPTSEERDEIEEVKPSRLAPPAASEVYEEDEDFEGDDELEDEEEGGDGPGGDGPGAEGPAEYVQREKSGRGRRIGGDVRPEDVDYKNIPLLSRFLDRRGRILSRRKTRVSAKVQRRIVQAIKRARHLALLPYTADQTRIVRSKRR
jgi:small subunit ribosomal protein S18